MTTTSPTALRAHVVAPGDDYHRSRVACSRCHRAVIPCDVITTSQHNSTITHHGCLTARQQAACITAPSPNADQCWYTDSRTLSPCPLPADAHNLCTAHHAQLCCAPSPKKPTPRRKS